MIRLHLIVLLIPFHAFSQEADISIVPILELKNWVAGLNIPVQVKGVELPASTPVTAELEDGSISSNDCKVMRDPFLPNNFIIKCQKDGTINLKLTIPSKILRYGPMTIHKIEGLKPPGEPAGTDPDISLGMGLFSSECIACHVSKELFLGTPGRNAAAFANGNALYESIRRVPGMKSNQSLLELTEDQLNKVAKYLQSQ